MANLNLYKTFMCVAEEKNLTKASEKMFISQPAVSSAIKELESMLGVNVFIRKNKGVELTPLGERLYNKCKGAVVQLENIETYFLDLKKSQGTLIKIGVNTSNLNQLFYDSITELLKTYPSAEISIVRYSEAELYENLEMGKLDYIAVDSEYNKSGLKIVTEFNIDYEILGNQKYYEKFKDTPLMLSDVSNQDWILANGAYTSRKNIDDYFRKKGIIIFAKFELDGYGYVKNFVENGYGLSIINPYYFRNEINNKQLYLINKTFEFPKRKIVLARLKNNNSNQVLSLFENIIENLVKIDEIN